MGVVYRAEDTKLERTVALKFLAPHLLESEEHKQRFLREAKAAASLDHPNICMVHEVGEAGGHLFLAMGYVDGTEVRAKIEERPLKLDEALYIAIQAAEGLRAAHQKGIVHRDIKSSNLMLTSAGQVKIMDFGLARLTGGTRLTKTDAIVGTPAYMSPEQAQLRDTDRRTDIWSLGVVLYEMVTGRLPFEGDREAAVVHSIINQPHEPVTALRVGVPVELDRILAKALAKKPEQRYQHLDDLLVDLRALRGGVHPAPVISRRRSAWAAAVLVAAALFLWREWRARTSAEPPQAVALTTLPGAELHPSLDPDGEYVAFTWNGPNLDNPDIYVQMIGSGSPLRLTTDPRGDYNPAWSPDGRWIAFLRLEETPSAFAAGGKSGLWLVPPLGGPERKIAEIQMREIYIISPLFPNLTWCPESNCLIVTDYTSEGKSDALFTVSLDTGEKRQLTDPRPPVLGDSNPAVSPDGSSLVFRRNLAGRAGELYRLQLGKDLRAAGEPERLTPADTNASYPAWLPDGNEILYSARGHLWRLGVFGDSKPARLPFVGEDGVAPTVSRPRSGKSPRLVYVRAFVDSNIWRVEAGAPAARSGSFPLVSIASTRWDENPQLSPDGRLVAFESNRSGEREIWVAEPEGTGAVQITSMGAPTTGTPRWSPDGQWITFDSNRGGQFEVYVVPVTGGKPRRVTSDPANDHVPSFSRDGLSVYFTSNRTGEYQIWKMPVSGGDAVQVTHNGGYVAFESPEGSAVYYTQTAAASSTLWRIPTSGGEPTKVLDGVVSRAFAVLRQGIYYLAQPSGEAQLRFFNIATGRATTLSRNLGQLRNGLTVSTDGRTVLYSRVDSSIDDLMLVENFR